LTSFCAWAIGSLTQDVVANEEAVRLDPRVERFFLGRRVGWITASMKVVTWLGSVTVVAFAAVIVGLIFFVWRRDLRILVGALIVLVGAIASANVMQEAVARPRPPAGVRLVSVSGWSFPSGHTTQALAGWGVMVLVGSAGRSFRVRSALWTAVALIALMVGVSRIYLGAHWFTDVLGAYALAGVWLAGGGAVLLATARRAEVIDEEPVPS
jgi:undecaprenyl-diphosphatase